MFVILLTANIKFRNRFTCSKGPMKRASKVWGDFQDLKSPGAEPPGNIVCPKKMYLILTLNFEPVTTLMSGSLVLSVFPDLYNSFDTLLICFLSLMSK